MDATYDNDTANATYNVTDLPNQDEGHYDERAAIIRGRTEFFMMAIIIPTGVIFNTTALVVFMRSKSLRKATTTHFLIALTLADSTYLAGK